MIYLVFLLGLVIGSFLNVCIYRIPRNKSIFFPSSYCTSCNHPLGALNLIPLFSYIYLAGRCTYCKDKISIQYPIVEFLTGLFLAVIFLKHGHSGVSIRYFILALLLIVAAFIDLEHKIIPNGLILFGTIIGVIFDIFSIHINFTDGFLGLLIGGGTLLVIALLSLVILKKEGMGGGDVKLMGMIGLFLGWKQTMVALILSIYIGGIIGGFLLLSKLKKAGDHISYGPFIALGSAITMLYGDEIMNWYLSYYR
jgi:leader peptidase (prepilin peptidase)/N-methyltransferase